MKDRTPPGEQPPAGQPPAGQAPAGQSSAGQSSAGQSSAGQSSATNTERSLPFTGGEVALLSLVGVGTLAAGTALVVAGRRRASASD